MAEHTNKHTNLFTVEERGTIGCIGYIRLERLSLSKHFALGWTEEKWSADMVLLIPYSYL